MSTPTRTTDHIGHLMDTSAGVGQQRNKHSRKAQQPRHRRHTNATQSRPYFMYTRPSRSSPQSSPSSAAETPFLVTALANLMAMRRQFEQQCAERAAADRDAERADALWLEVERQFEEEAAAAAEAAQAESLEAMEQEVVAELQVMHEMEMEAARLAAEEQALEQEIMRVVVVHSAGNSRARG